MIDRERLLQTFLDLVRISSPSKQERGVADYLKERLTEAGFEVREDDAGTKLGGNAGNLIATKEGPSTAGASIFFSAHMDTVEPTEGMEPVVTEDGVIRSDGKTVLGADCKAGIAATLEAARSAVERKIPFRTLQLLYSVSEETGLLGAKQIDPKEVKAEMGFVFDTEKPVAGIVLGAPTHDVLNVKIIGKSAHAGIHPEAGINAITVASRAIAGMKLGRIDEETTANVGVIHGGKATNVVPDEVEVRAEARSRDEQKLAAQVEHMTRAFHEAADEAGARVEIEVMREYSMYRFAPDDPAIKLAQRAARAVGIEPQLIFAGGGSDANTYNEKGLPAVVIGVGYEGPHSREENIPIENLMKIAQFALELIRQAS